MTAPRIDDRDREQRSLAVKSLLKLLAARARVSQRSLAASTGHKHGRWTRMLDDERPEYCPPLCDLVPLAEALPDLLPELARACGYALTPLDATQPSVLEVSEALGRTLHEVGDMVAKVSAALRSGGGITEGTGRRLDAEAAEAERAVRDVRAAIAASVLFPEPVRPPKLEVSRG